MTLPTPNDDLLIDVLAQVERDPASWDQSHWGVRTECGTAHCVAGWAVVLSGYEVAWEVDDTAIADTRFLADGQRIEFMARSLLGLSLSQANDLFHPANTLDRVYAHASDLLGVAPEVLRDKVRDRASA